LRPLGSCALLVVAALAGCSTLPDRGIEVSDTIEVHGQESAMLTAQDMIEREYGRDFGELYLNSNVYWSDSICGRNGAYAVIYQEDCYHGLTFSCAEMYVALSDVDPNHTTGSALLHEFGHCMYITMDGHGDATHSDDSFWGVINQATIVAKDRGW
jgi:hypothetical protein